MYIYIYICVSVCVSNEAELAVLHVLRATSKAYLHEKGRFASWPETISVIDMRCGRISGSFHPSVAWNIGTWSVRFGAAYAPLTFLKCWGQWCWGWKLSCYVLLHGVVLQCGDDLELTCRIADSFSLFPWFRFPSRVNCWRSRPDLTATSALGPRGHRNMKIILEVTRNDPDTQTATVRDVPSDRAEVLAKPLYQARDPVGPASESQNIAKNKRTCTSSTQ